MADDAVPQPQYTAAAAAAAHDGMEQYIQRTPIWVVVVRGLQVFFAFVVFIMAAVLIHGHAMSANGFALVCVSLLVPVKVPLRRPAELGLTRAAGLVHLDRRRLCPHLGEGDVRQPSIRNLGSPHARLRNGPLLVGVTGRQCRSPRNICA